MCALAGGRDGTGGPLEPAHEAQEEPELTKLDREIEKIRSDIRWQICHIRDLKAKGHSEHLSVLVLRLLRRTLDEERRYRQLLLSMAAH